MLAMISKAETSSSLMIVRLLHVYIECGTYIATEQSTPIKLGLGW